MAITDIIFIIVLIFLAANGAANGFVRSAVGPVTFLIGATGGWIWFTATHQTLTAILIAVIGPIILTWLIGFWLVTVPFPYKLSPSSKASGAVINIIWGGSMFLFLLAIPVIIPLESFKLGMISDDVMTSLTFKAFRRPLASLKLIAPEAPHKTSEENTEEAMTAVMKDVRIRKLMDDPEVQDAVREKNFGALLANPAIMEIAQDPALVTQMLKMYPTMQQRLKEVESLSAQ